MIEDLAADVRGDVAKLAISATPAFFDAMDLAAEARSALVSELLGVRGTDFEQVRVARTEAGVVGMWSGLFPVAQLRGRQLKTLTLLSRRLAAATWTSFQRRCAELANALPPPPGDGLYLARIAVDPSARGRGIGEQLARDFIAVGSGAPVYLHVRSDNAAAIRLYERLGFTAAVVNDFLLMRHTGSVVE